MLALLHDQRRAGAGERTAPALSLPLRIKPARACALGWSPELFTLTLLVGNASLRAEDGALLARGRAPVVAICAEYDRPLTSLSPPALAPYSLARARLQGVPALRLPGGWLQAPLRLETTHRAALAPTRHDDALARAGRFFAELEEAWRSRGPQIAPLGPIDSDQSAYNYIRRREQERDLGSRMTAAGLDEIIAASSQVLASAMALPLFRAGVYLGSPRLIERACTSAKRVTHSALRTSGNVDAVLQGCGALTAARQGSSDACGEGKQKLRDAYALLSAEKSQEAGRAAPAAARSLRDRCPKMTAPLRTPVDPGSRGFLIVWVLHANDAPPVTFLAGETAPDTADAINDAFLRGVQAVRPVAHNP